MLKYLNWKPCEEETYPSNEERDRTIIACPDGDGFNYYLFPNCVYGWNVLEDMGAKVAVLPEPEENENKKVYSVITKAYNGTILMSMYISSYPDKKLAEKVKQAIDEKNKGSIFKLTTDVIETDYFDNELDIPILNEGTDEI